MTTMQSRERLVKWLQDAYAMEKEAETMMKAMAARTEHYPELKHRIEQHVQETQQQSAGVQRCLELLDGSIPTAKGMLSSVLASMHAAGNSMMTDEVTKGVGISYAFEHLEIASYRALVVAARIAGEQQVAQICEDILQQEIEMAEWLIDHQEAIVVAFLEREQLEGVTAKR
ncbi:ferritin-like domain-containing protein [Xanthomonas campestris]|uniref:ferritin-like domain-containing protein n=1 Tax=Xanthomonas campestris TaxID=339 RepID=UPI002B23B918|nr:ferritin-like domain-containing protein [Xanthomonas campestris]MEA9763051.1 ferritin-like domain-containing protein [Xanthomonas campestris pv. raphani]MEA9815466.1 ferritin-like domain-containing protein [Xanthomonas campestris pv. raphani]MEA9908966.1 ferritin-like domain-containing protein [Xanthomonas campestris pv. raphani]MEA9925086.1 ferritin-like domain-containing protein [Xanthomonas campestris pv. raphani]MEA9937150.1 ferritin-like domain-containing protein [Xanthomonas campestri